MFLCLRNEVFFVLDFEEISSRNAKNVPTRGISLEIILVNKTFFGQWEVLESGH